MGNTCKHYLKAYVLSLYICVVMYFDLIIKLILSNRNLEENSKSQYWTDGYKHIRAHAHKHTHTHILTTIHAHTYKHTVLWYNHSFVSKIILSMIKVIWQPFGCWICKHFGTGGIEHTLVSYGISYSGYP